MPLAATDAAFEGFRLVRRNPLVLVWWTALYLLVSIGQLVAMYLNREQIAAGLAVIERFGDRFPATPEEFTTFMDAYNQVSSYGIWLLPLSIVVGSVLSAGIARGVLFPEQKAFGYLRLGMDEVRVFVVSLAIGVLTAGILGVVGFVVAILIGVAVMMPLVWLLVVAGVFAGLGLFIWLAVKWSLAIPIVLTKKSFAVFDSFAATKGHFWPLLGMAIIAAVMGLLIWFLSLIVVMPLSALSGVGGLGGPSMEAIEHLTSGNPMLLLSAAASAITYSLCVGIIYAPFAAAWRDLKAD